MQQLAIEKIKIYPKGRGEIFEEYKGSVSRSTFSAWLKDLEERKLIRPKKKLLSVNEVLTVYRELGVPGDYDKSKL